MPNGKNEKIKYLSEIDWKEGSEFESHVRQYVGRKRLVTKIHNPTGLYASCDKYNDDFDNAAECSRRLDFLIKVFNDRQEKTEKSGLRICRWF